MPIHCDRAFRYFVPHWRGTVMRLVMHTPPGGGNRKTKYIEAQMEHVKSAILPVIGEYLVAQMINEKHEIASEIVDRADYGKFKKAYNAVEISTDSNYTFDGFSKVDLVLEFENECIPVEIKLGTTGLGYSNLSKWMRECKRNKSSKNKINGKMMAILSRNFPRDIEVKDLFVNTESGKRSLSKKWLIIAQKETIDKWNSNDEVGKLLNNIARKAFKEIVDQFGNEDFNKLTKRVLDFDYYSVWLQDQPQANRA